MAQLRSSIDQWQVLEAVIDQGGFAQAAAHLHRSQSAVSYAMAQLQTALGVRLLEIRGRRARLTAAGEQLLRRSRSLLDQFRQLEALAGVMDAGWETELRLVVDATYPQQRLLSVLGGLRSSCPHTGVSLADAVLSGAEEAITEHSADVVVTARVPHGFLGDWLLDITMVAVAATAHPLHGMQRVLTRDDLVQHAQVVVRDSGRQRPRDEGWLGAQQRWIVASLETSHSMCVAGLAYAWLPSHLVAQDIAAGRLRPLPLAVGGTRRMPLYAVLPKGETAGPAARKALELLQRQLLPDGAQQTAPAAE
jgi:DNA-binding transcriptional LysR family regulator